MRNQKTALALGLTAIGRRKLLGGVAVLTAASTVATPAFAALAESKLRTFRARYAVRNGVTINGFFAAPKGKSNLDVVLVVPANDGVPVEEIARRYADNGFYAIAPDFTQAQGSASACAARDAKVAEVMRAIPGLKRMAHGNGRVTVVAA